MPGDQITVSGHYRGKNLYVQNPFAPNGVGFCTVSVQVNGSYTTDPIESSAYEIDFSPFHFKIGDPVTVVIEHKMGCMPKVLNPEVLGP